VQDVQSSGLLEQVEKQAGLRGAVKAESNYGFRLIAAKLSAELADLTLSDETRK